MIKQLLCVTLVPAAAGSLCTAGVLRGEQTVTDGDLSNPEAQVTSEEHRGDSGQLMEVQEVTLRGVL